MGWLGLHVDEAHGGSGYGLAEAAVVLEELGRACAPGPIVTTVLAAAVIDRLGDEAARSALLPGLVDGSTPGTVAFASAPSRRRVDRRPGRRHRRRSGGPHPRRLVGPRGRRRRGRASTRASTPPGAWPPCAAPARRAPRSVPSPAPASSAIWPPRCWPRSRWAARPGASTPPRPTPRTASSSAGRSASSRPSSTAAPTCSARSSWPGPRRGTPRAARRRATRSAVAIGRRRRPWRPMPSPRCAQDCVQVHGGIGFTWEHDAHLFLRRAHGHPPAPRRRGGLARAWSSSGRAAAPGGR